MLTLSTLLVCVWEGEGRRVVGCGEGRTKNWLCRGRWERVALSTEAEGRKSRA